VTQLAGRVGRGGRPGRVLVQSRTPDARSLRFAAEHDAEGFVADELARRELLRYPPFSTLIRIVFSSPDAGRPEAIGADLLADLALPLGSVLGPAPLFRLRGRHRAQILVKAVDRSAAVSAVAAAVKRCAREASRQGVALSVDVDPV
jgi:primosomal protein N' (replication factor Y)